VKGGRYIESLAAVDTVVLDKTGTLTLGVPEVVGILPVGVTAQDLLQLAASAEKYSEHPAARAILRMAAELRVARMQPSEFSAEHGKGIRCLVDGRIAIVGSKSYLQGAGVLVPEFDTGSRTASEVFIAYSGEYLGRIQVADVL